MALNAFARWELLQGIIIKRRTGRIVLQIGRQYLHWSIVAGKVVCIASTLPENSFSEFLSSRSILKPQTLIEARGRVNDERSLGSVLVRNGLLSLPEFKAAYFDYCVSLTESLLLSSNNMLWSAFPPPLKTDFVRADIPLWRMLVACDRHCLEIRTVVEFSERFPERYKLTGHDVLSGIIKHPETILIEYLARGARLKEILADPELDRLTCYRLPFLLWLSGFLHPISQVEAKTPGRAAVMEKKPFRIQAAWIVALVIGFILGLILAPNRSPATANSPAQTENLKQMLEQPAWRTDQPEE